MAMNKILERELLLVIKSIKNTATVGIDFVKTQAPDVVKQILRYEAVSKGICFFIWIISLIILIMMNVFLIIKLIPHAILDDNKAIGYASLLIATNFIGIGGLSSTIKSFQGFLKVLVAPKVFLIEYIQELMGRY